MGSWSTDIVAEADRFSYWREVISETVLHVEATAPAANFGGKVRVETAGQLRVASLSSARHAVARTRRHLAREDVDSYLVSLLISGHSRAEQGGVEMALSADDLAILDGQREFRIDFVERVDRIIVAIPHAMLDERAPWLRNNGLRRIAAGTRYADLARRHLLDIAAGGVDLDETAGRMLTENLANLLALASAPPDQPGARHIEAPIEAVLAYCRANLADSELTPAAVARHFGISVRTLHLRFHSFGQSFGQWLLAARLEAAGHALRDPRQAYLGVSDAAYHWGFNDLSHFNRSFKAHFGMTPRDWRMLIR